ncbi:hypothetical protein R1sor_002810 [Riccia sorocarpa]|uniref:Uncharacterized protein n=1 Tax=Riccia sorocarpa TaxID=122646 RepID=A0ABD3H0M4_9MARC
MLAELPSKLEIRETLFFLRKERDLGLDGANVDCLQKIRNIIEDDYYVVLKEFWRIGILPSIKAEVLGNRILSFEARVILIRHVLLAVPVFYLQVVGVFKKAAATLEILANIFLWGGNVDGNRKTSLAKWSEVKRDKLQGGLGVKDVWKQDMGLFAKQAGTWSILLEVWRQAWKYKITLVYEGKKKPTITCLCARQSLEKGVMQTRQWGDNAQGQAALKRVKVLLKFLPKGKETVLTKWITEELDGEMMQTSEEEESRSKEFYTTALVNEDVSSESIGENREEKEE